eukprot:Clim_evm1s136 gene=Clim_evmTU1s136
MVVLKTAVAAGLIMAFGGSLVRGGTSEMADAHMPRMLDFSYAGYKEGEVAPPTFQELKDAGWTVVDMSQQTEYGCVRNKNTRWCDTALSAVADDIRTNQENRPGTVIYFPEGKYSFHGGGSYVSLETISNLVIQGDGPTKTEIFMRNPYEPNNSQQGWRFGTPKNNHWTVADIVADADLGDMSVIAVPRKPLSVGDNVYIDARSDAMAKDLLEDRIYRDYSTFRMGELHKVNAVKVLEDDRVQITFSRPISVPLMPERWGRITLQGIEMYGNIGFQDLSWHGYWNSIEDQFCHHCRCSSCVHRCTWKDEGKGENGTALCCQTASREIHDYGWQAAHLTAVHDGWARNIVFRNFNNNALEHRRNRGFTYDSIKYEGKESHSVMSILECSAFLINNVEDRQYHAHGPLLRDWTTYTVIRHYTGRNGSPFHDFHANGPYATLLDANNGSLNGNGGRQTVHHVFLTVYWNNVLTPACRFGKIDGSRSETFSPLDGRSNSIQNTPIFVGSKYASGHALTLEDCTLVHDGKNIESIPSLYVYQFRRRTGKDPPLTDP